MLRILGDLMKLAPRHVKTLPSCQIISTPASRVNGCHFLPLKKKEPVCLTVLVYLVPSVSCALSKTECTSQFLTRRGWHGRSSAVSRQRMSFHQNPPACCPVSVIPVAFIPAGYRDGKQSAAAHMIEGFPECMYSRICSLPYPCSSPKLHLKSKNVIHMSWPTGD